MTQSRTSKEKSPDTPNKVTDNFTLSPPAVTLPKGGGAIRGIGEKFTANPVTGTGSFSVPIAISPGRAGFGPQLSLSYDSGAGNGIFGLGWNLSLPAISRKTDKGLPKYQDADESDIFILSGAEDLVPIGSATKDPSNKYFIQRYCPRIEGLFARIERWTEIQSRKTHWRSISRDNVTTFYGRTDESRILNPLDPAQIFSWLISESYDDKGNAIRYEYKAENSDGIDLSSINEKTRDRSTQRYLKRIKYGNKTPRQQNENLAQRNDWMFEAVFDYGEHYIEDDQGQPSAVYIEDNQQEWAVRQDPFSFYRSGFEVRTYRLCQRVLMFHHFPDELGIDNYLVRATHFIYSQSPALALITGATQSGYMLNEDGVTYLKKSLPPLEFEYSKTNIDETVREVEANSLDNLPSGVDGTRYQWIDLDSEGLTGVLTEQGGAWFYKRNVSALPRPENLSPTFAARFAPLECVSSIPSSADLSAQQLIDLSGDGSLDVVEFDGPAPGFFERAEEGGWENFTPFVSLPNIDWKNPNLKFIDLTGDGHADILIAEDEVFTWYPSHAEEGFGAAEKVFHTDEETAPRLVFADGEQSIYLSDFSGDGLTDLVRIRNGEICYWPNLGYGRFGKKITMDHAPWFDTPDQFDQQNIRLADIDGSGVIDILYLNKDGVDLYFNQSGNSWSKVRKIASFPRIDNLSSVMTADLLGNGTACLVWSSASPGEAHGPMRYIDLMSGQKPYLLTKMVNNLGAETEIRYTASTQFYLVDKYAGKPWITKLPFPVHVVEKVIVRDQWRKTEFASTYSYHHGYFDGVEREFRGFGRVEQIDVQTFDEFASGNAASPYITSDKTLYQPPIKTVTWYHTGAFFDREKILAQFANEYFSGTFQEHILPEPDLEAQSLSAEEYREALRACKGMLLRQESYELDVEALHLRNAQVPVKLFSTAYNNCHIQLVQPKEERRYAVFLVTESEAITYQYDLDLRNNNAVVDPRVAHTLNLDVDEYGNVRQSVAVVYPRRGRYTDNKLPAGAEDLIAKVQKETHIGYIETRHTNSIDDQDNYRLRVSCEVLQYELTGIKPKGLDGYFTLEELRGYKFSNVYQLAGEAVDLIGYHQLPDATSIPEKKEMRLVEHIRTLFFRDDLQGFLPLGEQGRRSLKYESYKLALTKNLLDAVFGDKLNDPIDGVTARDKFDDTSISGYFHGADLVNRFSPRVPAAQLADQYWIRSGVAGFSTDADQHFYLPEKYTDPFGNITTLKFDQYDLFIESSSDMLQNTTAVEQFDFRVLAPRETKDINGNFSEVVFDILGMPTAMVVKGKGVQGDNFAGFDSALINPASTELIRFFTGDYDKLEAQRLLGNATARYLYYFGEQQTARGMAYLNHPVCASVIIREQHVVVGGSSNVQSAFEYSDGMGAVLVRKGQAEPLPGSTQLRWIVSGKTILNNKGKPVKQYEPYFSLNQHRFEEPVETGFATIMYYDSADRVARTEMPDGSYSRAEFFPWHMVNYDADDTVGEPNNAWYQRMSIGTIAEQRAADLSYAHFNTPAATFFDSLAREVIVLTHNKVDDGAGGMLDQKLLTFNKFDAEGKLLWIRDANKKLVMQYIQPPVANNQIADPDDFVPCYDIAGNLLFQHSMDSGDKWTLMDAAGKPMLAWDFNQLQTNNGAVNQQRLFYTEYDELHRSTALWLSINKTVAQKIERFEYVDAVDNDAVALTNNLYGQLRKHYDASGLTELIRRNFKGNTEEVRRTLTSQYDAPLIDWDSLTAPNGSSKLEGEVFVQITEYDAIGRVSTFYNWHSQALNNRVAVYLPQYNERGALKSQEVVIQALKTPNGYDDTGAQRKMAIADIHYNTKGQKITLRLGNGTITHYDYDEKTFRLRQLRTTRPGYDPQFPDHHSEFQDQSVLQQLNYVYDAIGNVVEVYDEAYEPVFFQNQQIEARSLYEYDALSRLIKASGRESNALSGAPQHTEGKIKNLQFPVQPGDPNALRKYTQDFEYDFAGNILKIKHSAGAGGWTRHMRYMADNNRIEKMWEGDDDWNNANATNKTTYSFDAHGNMLNLANIAPGQFLRWDYRDMIASLDLVGGGRAYYNYDSDKQRTRKRLVRNGGVVEDRIYLGGYELYRRYRANSIQPVEEIESLHLLEGSQRVLLIDDVIKAGNALNPRPDGLAVPQQTLFRYQYGNHLGSACLELDHQAAIISYEEYHPYGTSAYRAMKSGIEVPPKRYRYTGMERDEESGLNYHAARYYAAWLGRWASADPIGIKAGLNRYMYVLDNPLRKTDADGTNDKDKVAEVADEAISKIDELDNPFSLHVSKAKMKALASGEKDFSLIQKVTMDIDEPLPVGETGLPDAAARARALDVNDRTFHLSTTNRQTKHLGIDLRARVSQAPISVVDDASALLTRPFGEIDEMREIFDEAVGKVENPMGLKPTVLKDRINGHIWDIIKEGKSDAAVKVRTALKSLGFENIKGEGYVAQLQAISAEGPVVASRLLQAWRGLKTGVGGALIVGGAAVNVAETVEASKDPDKKLQTIGLATTASVQLTGASFWLAGLIAEDAAVMAIGSRIALVGSLPGLIIAAMWPASVADATFRGSWKASYEPEDEPHSVGQFYKICGRPPKPQLASY